jgi:hypothetical protein
MAENGGEFWKSFHFCDGCAYAFAEQLDGPLLCEGEDFRRTDVRVVLSFLFRNPFRTLGAFDTLGSWAG